MCIDKYAEITDIKSSINMENANGSLPFYQPCINDSCNYTLAITGRSFAIVHDHYPELLERVRGENSFMRNKLERMFLYSTFLTRYSTVNVIQSC